MSTHQPFIDHYEWTDSIADWSEHERLTTEEKALLTADYTPAERQEGIARGCAHRALPLDVVEAKRQAERTVWPMTCNACNTGTPGECDCMPTEAASACTEIGAEPLTRREAVKFWAVAMAPGIALLGVVGFYILARFGHVW